MYVGTLLNSDPWIQKTFDIKGTFREKKAPYGGIRETVHDYRKQSRACSNSSAVMNTAFLMTFLIFCPLTLDLVLKRNLIVTENRSLQLDYLVNDTTYPGLEGTVLLHFNVTILPVHISFSNISLVFPVTRRASVYAQVLTSAEHTEHVWNFPFQTLVNICVLLKIYWS